MQFASRHAFSALAAALALSAPALAQSFNLDFGSQLQHPLPSNGYGAAAQQPGVWFAVSTNSPTAVSCHDINGNATGMHLTPLGGNGNMSANNASWTGDDDRLMEDGADLGTLAQGFGHMTFTITGLQDGAYTIYTYAEAPDVPATYRTNVMVSGAPEGVQTVGGAWSGSPHIQGITYAKHTITVAGGSTVTIDADDDPSVSGNYGTVNGLQIVKEGSGSSSGSAFCSGDGQDAQVTTPCPCGNNGAVGHGCANSVDPAGARLTATGSAALDPNTGTDTIVLHGSNMPATVTSIYLKGDTDVAAGVVFGDGIRCAGGALIRLGSKTNVNGASQFPEPGNQSVSVRGATPPGSGLTGHYQVYYRNAAAAFCPPETFNVSNGWKITW